MDRSFNPIDSQEPFEEPIQNPFEDPLLDAIEHDIEKLPGFSDPLVEQDSSLIDELAEQLEALENSIENPTSIIPGPSESLPHEQVEGEFSNVVNDYEAASDIFNKLSESEKDVNKEKSQTPLGAFEGAPPNLTDGLSRTTPPNPPRSRKFRRGRGGTRRVGRPPKGRMTGRWSVIRGTNTRYCPETNEPVDDEGCQSCEKYRHWPEGTDEEPKNCWYDWQARYPEESSDDNVDGY